MSQLFLLQVQEATFSDLGSLTHVNLLFQLAKFCPFVSSSLILFLVYDLKKKINLLSILMGCGVRAKIWQLSSKFSLHCMSKVFNLLYT